MVMEVTSAINSQYFNKLKSGDDWIIACSDQQPGSNLVGKTIFDLKHIVTGRFLYTEAHFAFNERNCGHNCPIMGQLEVSCDRYSNQNTKWKINSVKS